jgi:hypothetical protein
MNCTLPTTSQYDSFNHTIEADPSILYTFGESLGESILEVGSKVASYIWNSASEFFYKDSIFQALDGDRLEQNSITQKSWTRALLEALSPLYTLRGLILIELVNTKHKINELPMLVYSNPVKMCRTAALSVKNSCNLYAHLATNTLSLLYQGLKTGDTSKGSYLRHLQDVTCHVVNEELIFRLALHNIVRQFQTPSNGFDNRFSRILIANTIFAVAHLLNMFMYDIDQPKRTLRTLKQVLHIFLFPRFSILYETTGSIAFPILAHLANNTIGETYIYLNKPKQSYSSEKLICHFKENMKTLSHRFDENTESLLGIFLAQCDDNIDPHITLRQVMKQSIDSDKYSRESLILFMEILKEIISIKY